MPRAATPERRGEAAGETPVRQRILSAAFSAFGNRVCRDQHA